MGKSTLLAVAKFCTILLTTASGYGAGIVYPLMMVSETRVGGGPTSEGSISMEPHLAGGLLGPLGPTYLIWQVGYLLGPLGAYFLRPDAWGGLDIHIFSIGSVSVDELFARGPGVELVGQVLPPPPSLLE